MLRMFRYALVAAGVLAAAPGMAKVSKEEADQLKTTLTPMGGEKAANKDGSIPAWTGGLSTPPPCYKGPPNRICNPFAEDKPLYTINAQNLAQHKAKLTPGQVAMFAKFPDTYKLNVYQSRRTAAYADFVAEATYKNALNAELISNGEGIANAIVGIPFPIPKSGIEPIWNHKLRYRGPSGRRYNEQLAVTTEGVYNLVRLREDVKFPYNDTKSTADTLNNTVIYFLQVVEAPPRLAGTITLVHETMDQVKEPRRAWQYNPGQRRLRRAPNVGYDNPGTGSDGLRTNDQLDVFNGAGDRYTWKIVGKREAIIPYHNYALHEAPSYKDIVRKGHINQDLVRYEQHRVWVVEANLKAGTSHIYAKRTFYIDEDSWQVVYADNYDRRGQLWRIHEAYPIQVYDKAGGRLYPLPVGENSYDLISGRYILFSMNNESPETVDQYFDTNYYDPANVQKQATK